MKKITSVPNKLEEFLKELTYQNYHRHSSYSNKSTPDSGAMNIDYINRALELGHGILSSCEHGFQGNYWECYELAQEYNIKFRFGAEAYWVWDRLESDRQNNHICIFAKNEKGRRAINSVLSEANETGYYYKPRLDKELILSLPKDDVFITTACVGFWGYGIKETVGFVKELHNRFGNNFMLEVQYHNTEKQKELNSILLKLSDKLGIDIIMGCDSHYIEEHQSYDRDFILEYKKVKYAEEEGWFMDYPSTSVAYDRFKKQGILSELQILNAINNTNTFLEFDDIELNKDIKLPTLYPNYTQQQKDDLYKKTIMNEFKKYCDIYNVAKKDIPRYMKGIRQEVKTVIDTKMADYFLLDYELIKKGKQRGGVVTKSGRGSAVSFFTNTLLGFSNVDRFIAPVHLYPERFMSTTRIIETKSVPDIDMNLGTVEVFAEVQEELLGEGHSYPMIAYGTLKVKSAFKMYAGANPDKIDFDTSNEISKMLSQYEKDYNNAEEDEKDTIDVYDYIDEKYHSLFDESKKYRGIIENGKKHPCGYLIYSGNIREEIGLIKCKSETTKKEYIVALIDGKSADNFKYIKNDLLKVNVSLLHQMTADRLNKEVISVRELLEISKKDNKIWDIYKNGYTLGVNQCEKKSTTKKVMEYAPQNDGELSCFIAAIRPSFKSMYNHFSKRLPFEYGIKAFDTIVQTETLKNSFLLFQEQLMAALSFSGIPMDQCYELIKAISKKKKKFIQSYKEIFLNGFKEKIIEIDKVSEDIADENANKVWTIIEDSAKYGFNASHAYCMACDSMMDAYYKAYYPYEFYEVRLNMYSENGKKDKVSEYKSEMKLAFNIEEGKLEFRADNRMFTLDKENLCIHPALTGIKGIGKKDGEEIYKLKDNKYSSFIELYDDIVKNTSINKGKIEILIRLDYFSEFGKVKKLSQITDIYSKFYDRKQIKKDEIVSLGLTFDLLNKYSKKVTEKLYKDIDMVGLVSELTSSIEDKDISLSDKIKYEIEYLGYPVTKIESLDTDIRYIMNIDTYENKKSFTHYPTMYNVKTREVNKWRVGNFRYFCENKFEVGSLISITGTSTKPKRRKNENVEGGWEVVEGQFNTILEEWIVF